MAYKNYDMLSLQQKVNEIDNKCEKDYVDEKVNDINSSLEEKAKQTDLDTTNARIDNFTSLESGSTTGDAELIDARTVNGKTYANAGGAVRAVSSGEAIQDSAIKVPQVNFLSVVYTNLFDKTTAKKDYAIEINTGTAKSTTGYYVSDYIPVKGNTTYKAEEMANRCFYTSDKTFISGSGWTSDGTATTPKDACYMRFSWAYNMVELDKQMLVEGNTLPDKYLAYGEYIAKFKGLGFNENACELFSSTKVSINNIEDKAVNLNKVDFLKINFKNLFDKSTVTADKGVKIDTGLPYDLSGYYLSAYIPVKEGTTYKGVEMANRAYYDKDKVFISGEAWESTQTTTAPTGACYIRFCFSSSYLDSQMFVEGESLPDNYLPYDNSIVEFNNCKLNLGDIEVKSKLYGKVWNALGDSYTAGINKYHSFIAEKTKCTVRNYGIGGSTVTDYYTTWETNPMVNRYADMDDNADIVTIFGGVNDATDNDFPMGTIDSTDVGTFYGAYNTLLEGIIKKYPKATITTITPVKVADYTRAKLPDIVQAIKEVSAKYCVPCLDLYNTSGISTLAEQQASLMQADKLHPTPEGQKRLAGKILAFLESNMPLE